MSDDKSTADTNLLFLDNPHAPELFASGATSFWLRDGNVHITFESLRTNNEKDLNTVNRVVMARLIMPISGAQGLAAGLYDYLKSNGLDPVPTPDKSQLQ